MKFNPAAWVVIFGLVIFPPQLSAGPEECRSSVESVRQKMTQHLWRLENNFVQMNWQYWRYWEVVYGPLWEARLKMKDPFSRALKAEGEVLYGRYDRLAKTYWELARSGWAETMNEFEEAGKGAELTDATCPAKPYQNCLGAWYGTLAERLKVLRDLLRYYDREQNNFAEGLRKTLEETPSDHPDFAQRYHEDLEKMVLKAHPDFFKKIREIRDSLESEWPGQKCCQLCTADLHDPVLEALKLDPQGSLGAGGKVVNNASVNAAFERFDQEKKQEEQEDQKDPSSDQTKS